jgi:hypothetical protein
LSQCCPLAIAHYSVVQFSSGALVARRRAAAARTSSPCLPSGGESHSAAPHRTAPHTERDSILLLDALREHVPGWMPSRTNVEPYLQYRCTVDTRVTRHYWACRCRCLLERFITRMSHSIASPSPPPIAWPATAPITGTCAAAAAWHEARCTVACSRHQP